MSDHLWGEVDVEAFNNQPLSMPFSSEILCFTCALSEALLNCNRALYPDLVALGYWCRPKNIRAMQHDFMARNNGFIMRAKGTVFQVAPGNVDTLFLYSGILSLLMGNRTAIRVSQRSTDQLTYLLGLLGSLLSEKKYQHIAHRFLIFSGEYNSSLLNAVSEICDVRVIWGGDASIQNVRALPLSPHAKELSFADRHSFCLMNAAAVCRNNELDLLAANFCRDLLGYSQQACSSPKVLVWHGSKKEIEKAKNIFWPEVNEQVARGPYSLDAAEMIKRLAAIQAIAISQISKTSDHNSPIVRIEVDQLVENSLRYHAGYGVVLEMDCEDIHILTQQVTPRFQTLTYFGYERTEILNFLCIETLSGIDRICSVGEALNFDPIWDGYDLLYEFSRCLRR